MGWVSLRSAVAVAGAIAVLLPAGNGEYGTARLAPDLIGHTAQDQAGEGQSGTAGQHD
jgi:hypothetical protein